MRVKWTHKQVPRELKGEDMVGRDQMTFLIKCLSVTEHRRVIRTKEKARPPPILPLWFFLGGGDLECANISHL